MDDITNDDLTRADEAHRTDRRRLLVGGAGVLGAVAGSALLGHTERAHAEAPASEVTRVSEPTSRQKHVALEATVAPMVTSKAAWAEHEWEFGGVFKGEQRPVVVATAIDDHMEHDPAAFCVCAITVDGKPGAYRARIMVRNVSRRASSVTINAIAVGE